MPRFLLLVSFLFATVFSTAQELNCTVSINADQTGQPNLQVFRTLESQLVDFINTTSWTNKKYKNQERIECNMSIIITNFESNLFQATIQIQASRPIFQSSYTSPIYNYNDKQFNFSYSEFEPLNFNINTFDSNLISVIAFHVYTILGLDADTFSLNGGEEYFDIAKQIVNTAASSGSAGWKSSDGNQSRFRYNDALVSQVYKEFHTAMYEYHLNGLDLMTQSQKDAKNNIINAIGVLKGINDRRPNSYILRTFFDAKADEIQSIFSGGSSVNITTLVNNLNKMAPTKRENWGNIKF
ncbi:MAG: DUF4835 family protein [Bacteroidetes bacterium]|nr:DUF4835 family protein [Bacteroidota bacterium]